MTSLLDPSTSIFYGAFIILLQEFMFISDLMNILCACAETASILLPVLDVIKNHDRVQRLRFHIKGIMLWEFGNESGEA